MSEIPGEPRYTLEQAARIIPMPSVNALRILLHRHKYIAPPRPQPSPRRGRYRQPARVLTLSEIQAIQELRATVSSAK